MIERLQGLVNNTLFKVPKLHPANMWSNVMRLKEFLVSLNSNNVVPHAEQWDVIFSCLISMANLLSKH